MIILRQFAPAFGLPNPSPFCLKLETWLRMAGLDYEVKITPDPRKTPLGKLPVIEHDGRSVADSSSIITYLEEAFEINLNAPLNPQERGQTHALARMLEEHSYWALVYFRWLDEAGWAVVRPQFFGGLPAPMRAFVPALVRRQVRRDLHGQGLGRHAPEEIARRLAADLAALAGYLGERPYFGGYQPTNVDATAYAFLAMMLHSQPPLKPAELAGAHQNLVVYAERMRDRYFPEYA